VQATMMKTPLTLNHILERAGTLYPDVEVVGRLPDRSLHRTTYGDVYRRARMLAEVLLDAGLGKGDRVGTLMWNHYAHLEAYFGIPAAGGVLHTLNLRLHPDEIAYIVNHAEDRFIIVDDVLLPLLERFRDRIDVERIIVFPFGGQGVPDGMTDYEDFIARAQGRFDYPDVHEDDPCGMCYTSGTTGNPKGVVYSHRSQTLNSLVSALPTAMGPTPEDVLMPVVPMFHVNAWGLPYTAALLGCKQVYTGPHMDGRSLLELLESEQVTIAGGVPTLWLGMINELKKDADAWKLAPGLRLGSGGSATPESLMRAYDALGIPIMTGWGMTETSAAGTFSRLSADIADWPEEKQYAYRTMAGRPTPLGEIRVVNEDGVAPWDGETQGELQIRAPWVAGSYYRLDGGGGAFTEDGWFCTGDVAAVHPGGYVQITDRTKDLIKSGGEWISSVELENALMAHPAVAEAAVVAVPHPKWQERPLAVVVRREGHSVGAAELIDHLRGQVASWALPDSVEFVDELPHTSTGKLMKRALRERYSDWPGQ